MNQTRKARAHNLASTTAAALLASLAVGVAVPVAKAMDAPPVPMTRSAAPFVNWHQGFEHGTDGWYDASTDGPLGWCGGIQQVTPENRGATGLKPSAGRDYAVAVLNLCNAFWSGAGVPFGAPYAPGPELALYSSAWPAAGYVTELDIYLDPSWSEQPYSGSFAFAGSSPDTLVQYAATIFPLDYQPGDFHTGPHYFVTVDALRGQAALDVAGHTIREAGWYTFRFIFSNEDGSVRVDFELDDRNGTALARQDSLDAVDLWGPVQVPYMAPIPTAGYGSGHVWFFDIAYGLELPLDEHRVRRGR
jgi:hypothetical protein